MPWVFGAQRGNIQDTLYLHQKAGFLQDLPPGGLSRLLIVIHEASRDRPEANAWPNRTPHQQHAPKWILYQHANGELGLLEIDETTAWATATDAAEGFPILQGMGAAGTETVLYFHMSRFAVSL